MKAVSGADSRRTEKGGLGTVLNGITAVSGEYGNGKVQRDVKGSLKHSEYNSYM